LSKQEFLNFKEISEKVSFEELLNWLNIPFKKTDKELKGEEFIVSIEKNLFFSPKNENLKGSVINFLANQNSIDLREAAKLLKVQFLSKENEHTPKRVIPNLTLEHHQYLIERGVKREIAEQYEVGYVKQRSVMAGRIAFKIYDSKEIHLGYIGYKVEDGTWFFPKGFKRPLYNVHKIKNNEFVIVTTDPFDALRIISLGINEVVCLLANSMTSEQEEELKRFKKILLLHKEPQNIVSRLSSKCFIKAPVLLKLLKDTSDEELMYLMSIL
jgi:DNA primase